MLLVIDPTAPPDWLVGLVFGGMLSAVLALMILVAGLKRMARGEPFWPESEREEGSARRPRMRRVRSEKLRTRLPSANTVPARSARPNAESQPVQRVQPVAKVQPVQAPRPLHDDTIPANVDEVQRLAYTIALYSKRPNKELAIKEAWGATKGDGDVYVRASLLFDTAMTDAARYAAKQKGAALVLEGETA